MKWLAKMVQDLLKAARNYAHPREKMQEAKRQSRFNHKDGPMVYLGQQIVKAMQDAGYPAKIFCDYRLPEEQDRLYREGRSKAKAWQSPHQYLEAVDIVHPSKFWQVSNDYWDTLYACTKIVEERYGVTFEIGYEWGWDKAHIELKDWREVKHAIRDKIGPRALMRPPTPKELWARFEQVLPRIAAQHKKSPYFQEPLA